MLATYQRLQRQRAAGEIDGGFTLIELLIVIVVLGILAAIVVFALGGVTKQSAVAACQSDAKTVGIAVAALQAQNPSTTGLSAASWKTDLLPTTTLTGGPFLQSWPTGAGGAYVISVSPGGTTVLTGIQVIAGGATMPAAVTPAYGDVIVNVSTGTGAGTYDATKYPTLACAFA